MSTRALSAKDSEDIKPPVAEKKGSLLNGEPDYVCIGKIHRAHGVQGEVVFNPMTDFPERIRPGRAVFLGGGKLAASVISVRPKPPYLLIKFSAIETPEAASEYINQFAYVKTADLPALPDGEYYFHQLIGLEAVNARGEKAGFLSEILETGANDVYVIKKEDGQEELVPAIPKFIIQIDIANRKITIDFPEWA